MKLARRIAIAIGCVIAAWFIVILVIGLACSSQYGQRVADRMAEGLKATGSIGDSDLALVRGHLELERMHVERDDEVGKLTLDVAEVRCALPPLGFALFDRDCGELAIRGVRLDASTPALFKNKRPKRTPIHADSITLDDVVLVIAASAGRIEVTISHVEAGPTTFRTPLSWLFAMRVLRATVVMPLGKVDIVYEAGVLTASGSVLGARPLQLPIALPVADPADDPAAEIERLTAFGKGLVEQLASERLKSLINRP